MVKNLPLIDLVKRICDCSEISIAMGDSSHPCADVVSGQSEIVSNNPDQRQRPEPWTGNLGSGKLLFISSNPSISDGEWGEREDFPTWTMTTDLAAEFFLNRFNSELKSPPATFNVPGEPNFLTRSNDGEYRSGIANSPKTPVKTWMKLHQRAVELLGAKCHPHHDYAITEVVHCKSKAEQGVKKASQHCINKWMSPVLNQASAKVIILVGAKVRESFAMHQLGFSTAFGSDQPGYGALSQKERALRDIQVSNYGGTSRLYLFNWHPTGMIKAELLSLEYVYGENVINWVKGVIEGLNSVPANNEELRETLISLF